MTRRGRATDYVQRRALPSTGRRERWGTPWTEEQDKFLKAACLTTKSFGDIRNEFNKAFPGAAKSRNAIIGRAQRAGFSDHKPGSRFGGPQLARKRQVRAPKTFKVPYAGQVKRKVSAKARKAMLEPVVFKPALRDDNESYLRQSGPHTMKRQTAEQIAKARKGHLPCIIEEQPLTSIAMDQTAADCCKWPTSEDILCMEVCGAPAEYGAYCERHAMIAYREMPTRRRNANYARKGMLDEERRVKERDARMLKELEIEAPMLGADPVPLMIPHFLKDEAS